MENSKTMKAITSHAPWPYATFRLGRHVYNRSWCPPKGMLGERVLIHSGQRFDKDAAKSLFASSKRRTESLIRNMSFDKLSKLYAEMEAYPRGSLVGSVVITGWCKLDGNKVTDLYTTDEKARKRLLNTPQDEWATGPYVWLFEDLREFRNPVVCKGQRRIWDVELKNVLDLY